MLGMQTHVNLRQSLFLNLEMANSINAMKNTTMKMPVYTPALKMAPIASQLVRRNPDRTSTIAIIEFVFIINLFALSNKSQLAGQHTLAPSAVMELLIGK